MKKKVLLGLVVMSMVGLMVAGCGKKDEAPVEDVKVTVEAIPEEEPVVEEVVEEPVEEVISDEVPEGMYRSELTNLPISEELKDQRPIAAMVDNESLALPHFGLSEADVVYELMNSTLNGRITRLMVVVKDWKNIEQLGSIRSARPTNFMLAAEWNAVLCHEGGPFYIDDYIKKDYCAHLSGIFSRVNNGKATEYTAYILPGDLEGAFEKADYSENYDSFYPGTHYQFALPSTPVKLDEVYAGYTYDATKVDFPFPHNGSELNYNAETGTYDYTEYGKLHQDGEDDVVLSFTNVLVQKCSFSQLDDNGYMVFNVLASDQPGYYITNGKAIDITWSKLSETDVTRYYDATGAEITLNTGKTYVALVPDDNWSDLVIK